MPTLDEKLQQLKESKTNTETKSRRMQILVTPSMHDALKALAKEKDLSMNEIVNDALTKYLTGE